MGLPKSGVDPPGTRSFDGSMSDQGRWKKSAGSMVGGLIQSETIEAQAIESTLLILLGLGLGIHGGFTVAE